MSNAADTSVARHPPGRTFSYPREDAPFRHTVQELIGLVMVGEAGLRQARQDMRLRYPSADLHVQRDVQFGPSERDAWFAYRDGRDRPTLPATQWWLARGEASATFGRSGRLTALSAAFREQLGIAGDQRPLTMLAGFFPLALAAELTDPPEWLSSMGDVTSTSTLRTLQGSQSPVEYHVAWNGAGEGRHRLYVTSRANRRRASDRKTIKESVLGVLPGNVQRDLLGGSTWRQLRRGEHLEESIGDESWAVLVTAGLARVYVSQNDQEPTLTYAPVGAFVGSHMISDLGQRMTLGCQAMTPTTMLLLRPDTIPALVRSHPQFARQLAEHASGLLDEVVSLFAARSSTPLRERLAAELLRLQDVQPGDHLLSVTEQSLAEGVGSIRESVGRSIADFRRDGSVATTRFGVVVVDRPALELSARAGSSHS